MEVVSKETANNKVDPQAKYNKRVMENSALSTKYDKLMCKEMQKSRKCLQLKKKVLLEEDELRKRK